MDSVRKKITSVNYIHIQKLSQNGKFNFTCKNCTHNEHFFFFNFTKHKIITVGEPSGTQQAVVNQPTIATTEQPRQSVTSPYSTTYPEHYEKNPNIDDIQSEVLFAEKEKLKLEIEYIKLKMKKVSSEIEILELKKKSLTANCPSLS